VTQPVPVAVNNPVPVPVTQPVPVTPFDINNGLFGGPLFNTNRKLKGLGRLNPYYPPIRPQVSNQATPSQYYPSSNNTPSFNQYMSQYDF
jgi:hypothetical protein